MVATAIAPTGAMFTFLALWTGALWGKPMWGTWWVWDARLTSELILLFLYIGFMSLQAAIDDPRRADKAGAMIALVGVVNVPIIYFSVKWWNTLASGRHRQPYPIAQNGHHNADGHADHVDRMLDVCDCSHLDTYESHNSGAGAPYRLGRRTTRSGKVIWTSVSQFLDMGGYGFYVWGSYLVTLICIAGELVLVFNRKRTLLKHLSLIHQSNKQEKRNETAS